MHWRKPRQVRRRASGRTVAYNLRFPGQIFDGQAGLHQNWYRDLDPATGKYWESDPMGLKAGINTYAYVKDNPESFNDPTGLLTASTWGCDGQGNYVTFVIDTNPCTSECTKAHEQQHIADAKAKWGSELCRNKPKGYIPTAPENALPGYNWAYKHATECRAYRVEDACLAKMEGKCGCKDAAHARRYSALEGIDSNCNGT